MLCFTPVLCEYSGTWSRWWQLQKHYFGLFHLKSMEVWGLEEFVNQPLSPWHYISDHLNNPPLHILKDIQPVSSKCHFRWSCPRGAFLIQCLSRRSTAEYMYTSICLQMYTMAGEYSCRTAFAVTMVTTSSGWSLKLLGFRFSMCIIQPMSKLWIVQKKWKQPCCGDRLTAV